MSPRFLVLYVGLLLSLAAFSTDTILPALELVAIDLAIDVQAVQLVVPIYMLGFGVGQLGFGPASDRVGRRTSIIVGLVIYLIGTAVCATAPSMTALLVGRAIQGIGGGAGQAVARAVLRDRFSGPALASSLATASAIFAVGPMFAPLIGFALATNGDWRAVFWGMLAIGAVLLVVAFKSDETLRAPDPGALRPHRLFANTRALLGHRQSRYFLLLGGFVFTAIVTYLSTIPRIFAEDLNAGRFTFAVSFAIASSGIVAGQLINRRVIAGLGPVIATMVGAIVLSSGCALGLLLALTDQLGVVSLTLVMFIFNSGYLVMFSNAMSLTIDPHGTIAGFAASLSGFVGPLIGASLGSGAMLLIGSDPARWALMETGIGLVTLAALVWWRRTAQQ